MFDLDDKIAEWRRTMVEGGVSDPVVLDELENHLRDYVAQQLRAGVEVAEAFTAGIGRVGRPEVLKREFLLADQMPRLAGLMTVLDDRRKCCWGAMALSILVAAGYFGRMAAVTPVYRSTASIQLMQHRPVMIVSREDVFPDSIRDAEDLNAILRVLWSSRLRKEVAASLTPDEQRIVRRAAWPGEASSRVERKDEDFLGRVTVAAMRGSFVVRVAVVHADAEAAALIANRYVTQFDQWVKDQRLFRAGADRYVTPFNKEALDNAGANEIFIRVIEEATTPAIPFAPNLPEILQMSAGIALIGFVGLIAMAAALRKLVHLRMDDGPQVRTS